MEQNYCNSCIYHTLVRKQLLPSAMAFFCQKYKKEVGDCPDKSGVGIDASLKRTKEIVQRWVDLINKINKPGDIVEKETVCEECKKNPLKNPTFEVYCRQKTEWVSRCTVFEYLTAKIPPFTGRPDREEIINDDDIINVRIFAENYK
jgi:hypothetical protein